MTDAAELVRLAERLQNGMNSQPLTPMRVIDAGDLQTAINALRIAAQQDGTREAHELVGFVAIWAVQYQKDYGLDGLHPTHYDLLKKYGARMDSFTRATNARDEQCVPPR